MASNKVTKWLSAVNDNMVQHVQDMYLKGVSKPSIKQYIKTNIAKKFPDVSEHTVEVIYSDIAQKTNKALEEDKPNIAANLYSRLNYLYREALNQKDLTNARGCLTDIAKITGVTGNNNSVEIKNANQEIKISFGFGG